MNINALKKTMLGCYYCIKSMKYSPKFMKSMALYFVAVSRSKDGWTVSLILMFQGQAIYTWVKVHKF